MKINKLILFFIGIYLFGCSNSKDIETDQYIINGEASYTKHCSNCHGKNGEGLKKLYPAIANKISKLNNQELVCLIRYGSMKSNSELDPAMPSNKSLYDIDIAELISYLRSDFSNVRQTISADSVKFYSNICK